MFNLHFCGKITDVGISALAGGCSLLSIIDLSLNKKITDVGVSAIAYGCPLLSYINLQHCDKITEMSISSLVMHCRFLSTIDVTCCLQLSRRLNIDLKRNHPELRIIAQFYLYQHSQRLSH